MKDATMNTCRLIFYFLLAIEALAQEPLSIHCPPNQTNWICNGSFAFVTYPLPTTAGDRCSAAPSVTCLPPPSPAFEQHARHEIYLGSSGLGGGF